MQERRVSFNGAHGDILSARLSNPPDGRIRACALFAHCFTCSKDLKPVKHITRALTQAGIAVLRFDFTGLGESEGDFRDTTFSSNIEDLLAAAEYMEQELDGPAILLGHSLGGAAMLHAAGRIESSRAVATIGAPFDPAHVTHTFGDKLSEIEEEGDAEVRIAGRSFTVERKFLRDIEGHRTEQALATLNKPVLFFHSPVDEVVGIENAAKLYTAARHPKSFVSLDDAGHLLLDEHDARYVGDVLAAWASRYVEARETDRPSEDTRAASAPSDDRVSARTGDEGYVTEILASGHALLADEPAAAGGTDLGPNPYDLLSAALGACTTMTLRMYAQRKGWPLEEASVRLRHRKIHQQDEEACADREARMDRIEREVRLVGPLDEEQRARLMEIADRCPVHRTLGAGVVIETRESGDS
ncbi:MAG: bifunctional alpha/beta hydrolase/OsmC family protein [Gemmatimonadota bacterium]|nr:bifunctional alpha/beta hydrolase/OsmC family protein [Gemmatimonadota bacterium]